MSGLDEIFISKCTQCGASEIAWGVYIGTEHNVQWLAGWLNRVEDTVSQVGEFNFSDYLRVRNISLTELVNKFIYIRCPKCQTYYDGDILERAKRTIITDSRMFPRYKDVGSSVYKDEYEEYRREQNMRFDASISDDWAFSDDEDEDDNDW